MIDKLILKAMDAATKPDKLLEARLDDYCSGRGGFRENILRYKDERGSLSLGLKKHINKDISSSVSDLEWFISIFE